MYKDGELLKEQFDSYRSLGYIQFDDLKINQLYQVFWTDENAQEHHEHGKPDPYFTYFYTYYTGLFLYKGLTMQNEAYFFHPTIKHDHFTLSSVKYSTDWYCKEVVG